MASKNQVNLTLSDELMEKLDAAVGRYSKQKGRASVVVEVLETYLPLWEELQRQKQEHLNQQIESALGKTSAASLLPEISPARRKKA